MTDQEAVVPAAIAVDWGTSNFRAYKLDRAGHVIDRRQAPLGILNVPDGDFGAVFDQQLGGWLAERPGIPVLMSGMIGSRQGWLETPYADCPASVADLASRLTALPGRKNAVIVPGVAWHGPDGGPDVMRGEEVQVFGALAGTESQDRVLCLHGTHSKWVKAADGRLDRFATCMTGELFSALCAHTILGRLMQGTAHDPEAFEMGLARSDAAGGLPHHLFGVRTAGLFNDIPAERLGAYLSGILIGHEVKDMLGQFPARKPVLLIGTPEIAVLYARAIRRAGAGSEILDSERATVRGLALLTRCMTTETA